MAREIVITSVPRGVKLGRTGFQVAMQTAGMRDDVAAVLEKMAGYRHLSAGSGANPVCYFHRVARTVAGQMHVLGRIIDAGVDFSNRSNKLAHMVVLEAADLSAVAAASPAAVLAAIEGRLASTWPGGPEERRQPFALAGIPPSQPAVCGLWQQVMGDAGWAGVIAERAVRNEPTLLIGPDSSPASCRRMLALFAEALAIVPPAKRWSVTFDTTTLVADGVLWRGTYAGSPESQVAQPGVLIVNLSAPQPVPQNLLAGELVQVARVGAPSLPVGGLPVPPGGVPPAPGVPVNSNPPADGLKGVAPVAMAGGPGAPPPAPFNEDEWEDLPLGGSGRKRGGGGGLLAAGIVFALLAVLGIVAVGGFFVWTNVIAPGQAMQRIQDFADNRANSKALAIEDVCTALRIDPQSPEADAIKANHAFLVDALANKDVKSGDIEDAKALKRMLGAIEVVTTGKPADSKDLELLLGSAVDQRAAALVAVLHPDPFTKGYDDFRDLIGSCTRLVKLADTATDKRKGATIDDRLWQLLVTQAQQQPQGAERDYGKGRAKFVASVGKESVTTAGKLIDELVKCSPPKKDEPRDPPKVADADPSEAGGDPSKPVKSPVSKGPSAGDAFQALRNAIMTFRKSNKTISVEPEKGTTLFEIAPALAKALDAEVVVGSREGLDAKAARDGSLPAWKLIVGEDHAATIDLAGGKVVVKRGGEAAWNKHWQAIRFMPIAFCRPGQKPSKDDWLVLTQPESKKIESEQTLFDLLCGEGASVPLPEGVSRDGATARWATWQHPDDKQSPRIRLQPKGADAMLEVVGRIDWRDDEGKDQSGDYVLTQRLSIDDKEQAIRRTNASWTSMHSRLGALDGKHLNPIQERTKLAFKDGKLQEFSKNKDSREESLELIVHAIILDYFGNAAIKKDAKDVLANWSPKENAKGVIEKGEFDEKKFGTVVSLRSFLQGHIASEKHGFGRERRDDYKNKHHAPSQPGKPLEKPVKQQGQSDDDFKKLDDAYNDYIARLNAWSAWEEAGRNQVKADAKNVDLLREYLAKREKDVFRPKSPKEEPRFDPDLSAICVLLELDAMVVAKAYRAELETLLRRVPVAGLLEGDATEQWKLDGIDGPVTVTVAKLRPADLLPPPVKPQDTDTDNK